MSLKEVKTSVLRALAYASLLGFSLHATAVPVFSASLVVTSVDRSATFDSLTSNGIVLAAYAEDSLSVTVNDTTFQGFSAFSPGDGRTTGFHYGASGNNEFVTIAGTDGAVFSAVDFLLGDGEGPSPTNVQWETFLSGMSTGTGIQSGLGKGQNIGWTDATGFDELRVAAASSESSPGFGNFQALAIDELRAQLAAAVPVPEPATLALLGIGLAGLGFTRRRLQ